MYKRLKLPKVKVTSEKMLIALSKNFSPFFTVKVISLIIGNLVGTCSKQRKIIWKNQQKM